MCVAFFVGVKGCVNFHETTSLHKKTHVDALNRVVLPGAGTNHFCLQRAKSVNSWKSTFIMGGHSAQCRVHSALRAENKRSSLQSLIIIITPGHCFSLTSTARNLRHRTGCSTPPQQSAAVHCHCTRLQSAAATACCCSLPPL